MIAYLLAGSGGNYWSIPYRNLALPPISLWEHDEALRRLKAQGQSHLDEDKLMAMVVQQRRLVEQARSKTARCPGEGNLRLPTRKRSRARCRAAWHRRHEHYRPVKRRRLRPPCQGPQTLHTPAQLLLASISRDVSGADVLEKRGPPERGQLFDAPSDGYGSLSGVATCAIGSFSLGKQKSGPQTIACVALYLNRDWKESGGSCRHGLLQR